MKHTPGPWLFIHSAQNLVNENRPRVITSIHPICEFTFDSDILSIKECNSNARLIAAAPELLEALQNLYEAFPKGAANDNQSAKAVIQAKAVISKAI